MSLDTSRWLDIIGGQVSKRISSGVSLVRSPDMSLDMSRWLDIIGGQVSKRISSGVAFRTAFFDLAFVT